jgi:hypothetical protein
LWGHTHGLAITKSLLNGVSDVDPDIGTCYMIMPAAAGSGLEEVNSSIPSLTHEGDTYGPGVLADIAFYENLSYSGFVTMALDRSTGALTVSVVNVESMVDGALLTKTLYTRAHPSRKAP